MATLKRVYGMAFVGSGVEPGLAMLAGLGIANPAVPCERIATTPSAAARMMRL